MKDGARLAARLLFFIAVIVFAVVVFKLDSTSSHSEKHLGIHP